VFGLTLLMILVAYGVPGDRERVEHRSPGPVPVIYFYLSCLGDKSNMEQAHGRKKLEI
jgi:hypothetical protein